VHVVSRLERIEALGRERAPAERLLGELRELVREAEAWSMNQSRDGERCGAPKLRRGAEGMS
jgi:hypothetical protein